MTSSSPMPDKEHDLSRGLVREGRGRQDRSRTRRNGVERPTTATRSGHFLLGRISSSVSDTPDPAIPQSASAAKRRTHEVRVPGVPWDERVSESVALRPMLWRTRTGLHRDDPLG